MSRIQLEDFEQNLPRQKSVSVIMEKRAIEHHLVTGLTLALHEDECESYYHNLMSPKPGCFVVAEETNDADEMQESKQMQQTNINARDTALSIADSYKPASTGLISYQAAAC